MRRLIGETRGKALVAVLIAGFLIMAMGLGVLSRASTDFDISRRAADWESAFYAAWAGIEHTLGEMNARFPDYVGRSSGEVVLTVPETALGNGSYSVVVTSLGGNRYEAVSTGRARSSVRRIAATLAFRNANAAYYHIWGSEYYRIGGNSEIYGDLYSADTIELDGWTHVIRSPEGVGGNVVARNEVILTGNVIVDGDVTARTVSINSDSVQVHGSINAGFGPAITMPEITLNGIRAMRPQLLNEADPTEPYELDCTNPTGRHRACGGGYWLHKGDLTVYGEFTGRTVIGVEGASNGGSRTVLIPWDLVKQRDPATGEPADPHTLVAIVSDGANSNLTIKGGRTVEALLYTTDQRVDLPGNVTVIGAIIAHKVDNNGNLFFQPDPTIEDMMPGLPGVRLVVVEWHEL